LFLLVAENKKIVEEGENEQFVGWANALSAQSSA